MVFNLSQNTAHFVPRNIDFNDVLDQLYLYPCSGLLAIFSNCKINGDLHQVDVTRRIKRSVLLKFPQTMEKSIYQILVQFSLREFNYLIDLIKKNDVDEYDCYRIEKEFKKITLPVNSYLYLIEEEQKLKEKLRWTKPPQRQAILVFKRTSLLDQEIRKVSSIIRGKVYTQEKVDRKEITTYDLELDNKKRSSKH